MNEFVVNEDIKISSSWVEKMKPIIEELLNGWRIIPVEGEDNIICKILDMSCGIDYLMTSPKSNIVTGMASRVQYSKNYRTFTVRKERESQSITEFDKRKDAILYGGLYPKYTMQAYIVNNDIDGLAIIKTKDLIEFIKCGFAEEKQTGMNKIGQASFYICEWDKIKENGYKIREYNK